MRMCSFQPKESDLLVPSWFSAGFVTTNKKPDLHPPIGVRTGLFCAFEWLIFECDHNSWWHIFLAVLAFLSLGLLFGALGSGTKQQVFTGSGAREYNALRERRIREEISQLEFIVAGYDIKFADPQYKVTRYEKYLRDLYTRQADGELDAAEAAEAVALQTRLMKGGLKCDEIYVRKAPSGSPAEASE
ncbi:hypothetical protein KIV56_04590 [Cryobacterium breve]|uniref:Uncharacterized protein n=1 Tax=Cryobacterium breve TaxID=1259258 RepID=A0ABY7NEH2_9MICO|nr:hypothetical protein [Cryobacterium breve]WBM80680.1 hypothetical protein KIV56_04590 [Cryobacterium breve]